MTAVAMASPGGGAGHASSAGSRTPKEGTVLSTGHRAFKSFDDFKDFMGSPGSGNQWHHIVEQREANLKRFGPEALRGPAQYRECRPARWIAPHGLECVLLVETVGSHWLQDVDGSAVAWHSIL
jgi:hypothetical protein